MGRGMLNLASDRMRAVHRQDERALVNIAEMRTFPMSSAGNKTNNNFRKGCFTYDQLTILFSIYALSLSGRQIYWVLTDFGLK